MGNDSKSGRVEEAVLTIERMVAARLDEHRSEIAVRSLAFSARTSDKDVEAARSAAQRMLSELRFFAPLFEPAAPAELGPELEWFADTLGRIRDLDVMGEVIESSAGPDTSQKALGQLLAPIVAERDWSLTELADLADSDRFQELLATLDEFVADVPIASPDTAAVDALPELVRASWSELRRAARGIDADPPIELLQRLGTLTERHRDAIESVHGLGFEKSRTLHRRLNDLLDHLSQLDAHIAAETWLREHGPDLDDSADAFVAGELAATMRQEAERLAATWREPWERVDRKSLRRWF